MSGEHRTESFSVPSWVTDLVPIIYSSPISIVSLWCSPSHPCSVDALGFPNGSLKTYFPNGDIWVFIPARRDEQS